MVFEVEFPFFTMAGRGAPDGPFGTELTSVDALSASTDGAERMALASMAGVDGAGSSATGGELGAPHSQLVELILDSRL